MNINSNLTIGSLIGMKCLIADIRKSKGIQQSFLAKQVGISQQLLSEYERGKSYPRVDRANLIAKVLGVQLSELYKEE